MSEIYHSRYVIPERCSEPVLIEAELITGKTGLYYTSDYGFRDVDTLDYIMGWMFIKRWRFVFDEEEVKDSGL